MKKAIKSKQSNIYKPIYEGKLWKRGKNDKWKQKYFSLFSDCLEFRENITDDRPQGRIPIFFGSKIDEIYETEKPSFKITNSIKSYQFLVTENKKIYYEWLKSIQETIDSRKKPKQDLEDSLNGFEPKKQKTKKYIKKKKKIETKHDLNIKEMNELYPELKEYLSSMTEPNYPAKFECSVEDFSTVSLFLNCSIYILPDHFCFYSSTLGKEIKKILFIEELSEIEQKEDFLSIKNSEDEREWCFGCFENDEIEACQNIITHLLEKKNIQLITISNGDSDSFDGGLTSIRFRQPTDYEASIFEETEENDNSENDTDFVESGDEEELPSKRSKFYNLFSNYLENQFQTKISIDENPIHQDFCLYIGSKDLNKKLIGILYFVKDFICFSGFESKNNKPTLWCLSFNFIKEILFLKNSIHNILKIILIDESYHLIILEKKSFSIISNEFLNQINDISNLFNINLNEILNVNEKNRNTLLVLKEIYFSYKNNIEIDMNIITKILYPIQNSSDLNLKSNSNSNPNDSNISLKSSKIKIEPSKNFLNDTYDDLVNLDDIINKMKDPKLGVVIKNRRYYLKTYESCFIGSEMVSWIIENVPRIKTRDDAVLFGQEILEEGYFDHVVKEKPFKDIDYFYRFKSDEKKLTQSSSFFQGAPTTPRSSNIVSSIQDQKRIEFQKHQQNYLTLQSFQVQRISNFMTISEVELQASQNISQGQITIQIIQNQTIKSSKLASQMKEINILPKVEHGFYILFSNYETWKFQSTNRLNCIQFFNEILQQISNV
eukprot:gene1044-10563_t